VKSISITTLEVSFAKLSCLSSGRWVDEP